MNKVLITVCHVILKKSTRHPNRPTNPSPYPWRKTLHSPYLRPQRSRSSRHSSRSRCRPQKTLRCSLFLSALRLPPLKCNKKTPSVGGGVLKDELIPPTKKRASGDMPDVRLFCTCINAMHRNCVHNCALPYDGNRNLHLLDNLEFGKLILRSYMKSKYETVQIVMMQ